MMKGNLAQQNKAKVQNRSRRGFTLPEVLLTVAILVVIFAVTIVGVSKYQLSLRQKELDSKAEVIYMAAQNRLTELCASGRSDLYTPTKTTTVKDVTTAVTLLGDVKKVDVKPQDRKESEYTKDLFENLYYVEAVGTGASDTAAVILPADRVESEIRDNYWVIEYSPDSASVYAVFYSESNDEADFTTYTPRGYDSLRIKEARLKKGAKVGYYGGDAVKTVDTTQLNAKITINNEEKLIATFWSSDPYGDDVKFDITITDSYDNKWKTTIASTDISRVKRADGGWAYSLTLDSLLKDERFCEVYGKKDTTTGNGGLIPGSNLTIDLKVSSLDSTTIKDGTATATTNSLFADESKDGTDGTDGVAVIKYARHLQNLDSGSGFNTIETTAENAQVTKITKAIQKSNIHFEDDPEDEDDWYTLYTAEGVEFKAIDSPYLDSYEGEYEQTSTSTEGTEGEEGGTSTGDSTTTTTNVRSIIYGLDTTGGLFSTFKGSKLSNITISGGNITGDSDGIAGGIAAKVQPTGNTLSITGCQVYLEDSDISAITGDNKEKHEWITADSYVGGLVGQITSGAVTIEKSFASTVLGKGGNSGTTYTGGLVGHVAGSLTMKESYADSYFYGENVGGLVGNNGGTVNVTNSYVAGFSYATTESAGFIGAGSLTSSQTSYSVLHYDGDNTDNEVNVYGIAKFKSGNVDKTYYCESNVTENDDDSIGEGMSSDNMSDREKFVEKLGNTFSDQTGDTHAYNLKKDLGLTSYSYPKLTSLTHYGDWYAGFVDGTPVYYEVYTDGSYGFYGANLNKLKDELVVGDGYGVIYSDGDKIPGKVELEYKNDSGELDKKLTIKVDNDTYYLQPFPNAATNTTYADKDLYQDFTLTFTEGGKTETKTYYYCPHFSRDVYDSQPSGAAKTIYVRSARQLYNMSLYYTTYANAIRAAKTSFEQPVDIDYSQYKWTEYTTSDKAITEQGPIGASTDSYRFRSSYDGNNNTITGVSFVAEQGKGYYAGLFGFNMGTLSNIAIVWDYQGDSADKVVSVESLLEGSKAKTYMGVLAGRNSSTGKIRNCAVTGYVMDVNTYENSSAYIGGLVGYNNGRITYSYADIPSVELSTHYSNTYFGGLTGTNTGYIRYCYAQTAVEIDESKGGNAVAAGFCGNNSGGTIKNAYCGSSVITAGASKGYGFAPSGGTVSSCYYLNDGSYFYAGKLRSYNILPGDLRVQQKTAEGLRNLTSNLNNFGKVKENSKKYNTKTEANDTGDFPYPAVYKNANSDRVHYGNWPVEASLGNVGMLYWEYESTGANKGYHFHYIGINGDGTGASGTSLCTSHDDGGVITDYGYAYYVKTDDKGNSIGTASVNDATTSAGGFAALGDVQDDVSREIEKQLKGFDVTAYKTDDKALHLGYDSSNDNKGYDNGKFVITYTKDSTTTNYSFTVCPFFADSFTYDGEATVTTRSGKTTITTTTPTNDSIVNSFGTNLTTEAGTNKPGQTVNNYQIRSAKQLQYINWNAFKKNAKKSLEGSSNSLTNECQQYCKSYAYLKYVDDDGGDNTSSYNYYWNQTHDVDQQGSTTNLFTPIGSMYYYTNSNDNSEGRESDEAWIAFMGGSYNGGSYMIKNIEINTSNTMVGLFGITMGANLQNIVMYSDNNNTINIYTQGQENATEETDKYGFDDNQWYSVGGLVGFAASGTSTSAKPIFYNCSVSGYTIKDSRCTHGHWGGGSVGGLVGSTNMNLSNCSAVNDIKIAATYNTDWRNIRVGGLVGNLRATVDSCYSGGTMKSTAGNEDKDTGEKDTGDEPTKTTSSKWDTSQDKDVTATTYSGGNSGTSIWMGGINGGIVMINYGNLDELVGTVNDEVIISNSYTYAFMQKAGTNRIKYTSPIGSLGEMYSKEFAAVTNSNVAMYNCYAYEPYAETTTLWTDNNSMNLSLVGSSSTIDRHLMLYNKNVNPLVSYDKLADTTYDKTKDATYDKTKDATVNGVRYLLNENGKNCTGTIYKTDYKTNKVYTDEYTAGEAHFSFVTTEENGAKINGKYSFPGSNSSLDGANYPFPAILTQSSTMKADITSKSDDSIYVHYGTWPQSGMYWGMQRLNLDILEMNSEGKLYTNLTLNADKTPDPSFQLLDEDDKPITDTTEDQTKKIANVGSSNWDPDNNLWNVVINALRTGSMKIQAKQGNNTSVLLVNITANMVLTPNPEELDLTVGTKRTLSLTNTNEAIEKDSTGEVTNGKSLKYYTEKTDWELTSDDENIAYIENKQPQYNSGSKSHEFTIVPLNVGEATITAKATYKVLGVEYTSEVAIPVTVVKPTEDSSSGDTTGQ